MTSNDLEAIVRDCHARGFSLIPLAPGAKAPGDPRVGYAGCSSRSSNLDLLLHWAEQEPNYNAFICSDPNYTILESDDFDTLQRYVGDISEEIFGKRQTIPETLTGGRRPDRPHLFFRQTPATLMVKAAPGVAGVFEWRHGWLHSTPCTPKPGTGPRTLKEWLALQKDKKNSVAYQFTSSKLNNMVVTISGQEVVNKTNSPVATVTINTQNTNWVVSTGILFSNLKFHTFTNAPIVVNGKPVLDASGKVTTIVTRSDTSPSVWRRSCW